MAKVFFFFWNNTWIMHNKTRWKSIYQTLNPVLHSANVFGLKSLKYQPTTSQTIFFPQKSMTKCIHFRVNFSFKTSWRIRVGNANHNHPNMLTDPASTKWAKRMCFQMPQDWGQSSASADVRQQGQWDRNSQLFPQALSVRMRSNGPEVTACAQSRKACPILSEKPVIFGLKRANGALIKLYCVYGLSWKSLLSRLRGNGRER